MNIYKFTSYLIEGLQHVTAINILQNLNTIHIG